MNADDAHASDDLFKRYPLKNFKSYFKSMQSSMARERDAIAFDQLSLQADMTSFPRNAATERGYLFWDGHPAQTLLAEDVKEGRAAGKAPTQLQQEREEYKEFPLHVFRKHLYQEERKQREKVYWQKKRNDKQRKNYEKEVRERQQQERHP
jgi:hypothetical protein